ncbi:MAG: hypothetical protein HKM24_05135 [Gammaproteobacteria bacterium]|nr:hypothetical protein [Gammaproteobacteria bacterium]
MFEPPILAQPFLTVLYLAFANNLVLFYLGGLGTALNVSRRLDSAMIFAISNGIIIALSSVATWILYKTSLQPLHWEILTPLLGMLVAGVLVLIVDRFWLHRPIDQFVLLTIGNSAIIASLLAALEQSFTVMLALAIGSGIGFIMVVILLTAIRARVEDNVTPHATRGLASDLLVLGLMAVALTGLVG